MFFIHNMFHILALRNKLVTFEDYDNLVGSTRGFVMRKVLFCQVQKYI